MARPLRQPAWAARSAAPAVVPISVDADSRPWPVAPGPSFSQVAAADEIDPNSLDKLLEQLPELTKQKPVHAGPSLPAAADSGLPAPARLQDPGDAPKQAPAPDSIPPAGRARPRAKSSLPARGTTTFRFTFRTPTFARCLT